MPKTLYICYFGLREPLVQTQVLPYLREIRNGGTDVSIVTFEPDLKANWTARQIDDEKTKLASEGIDWHCLTYHKWPSVPATIYDIFRGALFVHRFIKKRKPDVLHGRVHLPTLMGALARKFSRHKPKLLFDIRGFFPEEYTDAGIWPEGGWLYRGAKSVEKWLLKESDGFVVLTEQARTILFPESRKDGLDHLGRPIEVIPCCVDFDERFSGGRAELRALKRNELAIEDRVVFTHLGALGGLYLSEEIVDFLAAAKSAGPPIFALFLTQSDTNRIVPILKSRGFAQKDYLVQRVAPGEVQSYLSASDFGLSFVRSGYATASRSPTKIPEYLAAGLPIIANTGVGDVDELVEANEIGVVVPDFTQEAYRSALNKVSSLGDISTRCKDTARRDFDLKNVGGKRYRRIYQRLLNRE